MPYTKVIISGDEVEIYKYTGSIPERSLHKRPRQSQERRARSLTIRPDNAHRRRRSFERLVKSNLVGSNPPIFLTLTMATCVSLSLADPLASRFFASLRRKHGQHVRYIYVPEFQERGAVHYHALVWGLSDETILTEGSRGKNNTNQKQRWLDWLNARGYAKSDLGCTRALQRLWARGYVDIVPTDNSSKLARYLSSYMHKTMQDERLRGGRAYRASGNILRPLSVSLGAFSLEGVADEILGCSLESLDIVRKREYNTKWLGRGQYTIYKTKK